jgi:hypothetical protein
VIIYGPRRRRGRERACRAYCQEHGYGVVAVVADVDGGWPLVAGLLRAGQADVVIVYSRDDLPPNRTPRLEVVEDRQRVTHHAG